MNENIKTSLQKIAKDLRYVFGWELTPDQVFVGIANTIPYLVTIIVTLIIASILYFGKNALITLFVLTVMIIGCKIKSVMLDYREDPKAYKDSYSE